MEETLKDSEKTNLPGKILTGPQDRFAVSEQARNRIIAFETGEKTVTVWVDTNNQLANDVLSAISQMEASGYQVQIVPVDMGLIRSSYAHESGEGDTSEQQSLAMSIFRNAADENASDIHIVTTRTNQSRILFRINGDLEEQPSYTRSYEQGIQLIRTIYNSMASEGSNNFRIDGNWMAEFPNDSFCQKRWKVSVFRLSGLTTTIIRQYCDCCTTVPSMTSVSENWVTTRYRLPNYHRSLVVLTDAASFRGLPVAENPPH